MSAILTKMPVLNSSIFKKQLRRATSACYHKWFANNSSAGRAKYCIMDKDTVNTS